MPKSKKRKKGERTRKHLQSNPLDHNRKHTAPKARYDIDHTDVVIPVFNQLKLLQRTVETVRATAGERLGNIVFVDDASDEDGVAEFCRENGKVVSNNRNLGFAKSSNRGVGRSGTEFVVLMNSDLEATEGWLDALVDKMNQDEKYAVVGPLLVFPLESRDIKTRPPGKVQSCGFAVNIRGIPYHRLVGWSPNHFKVQAEHDDLQGITAACWLIRRPVWDELGGFEESFRSYFEDIDFCVRARTAGYKIAYTPNALLYHHVGSSWDNEDTQLPAKANYMLQRNQGRVFYDEYVMM